MSVQAGFPAGISRIRRFKLQKSPADISRALQVLAIAAARRSPYYRDLMVSAGVRPHEVRSIEALKQLPVTNKQALLSQPGQTRPGNPFRKANRLKWSTSGTTGQVLFVPMSRAESAFRSFSYYQAIRENAELSWPLTIAHVGAGQRESKARPSTWQRAARLKITRICRLLPVREQVALLLASRPQIITGHPSCLEVVAESMVKTGTVMETGVVVCRGEVLSSQVRELLTQAFNAKVADYYNAEEIGNIAYECPADSARMHINTDCCILEILDEHGASQPDGREGRIVATNLFNHSMPFIRYDLGDRGVLISEGNTRCKCGSLRPSIRPPLGRSDDFFHFPSGVRLSPRAVESLIVPALLRMLRAGWPEAPGSPPYQIVQESEEAVRFVIAATLPFREELRSEIECNFRRMGIEISLTVNEEERIPAEKSGKSRRIISKVRKDQ